MTSFFNEPSRQWNRVNLRFDHELGGCSTNRILTEMPMGPLSVPGKFDVPAESTPDFTDWAYGEMPHTMTARPLLRLPECCDCHTVREFDIARDTFGPANGRVSIQYPCAEPCFVGGCQDAEVKFTSGGQELTGVYGYNACTGFISTEEKLTWTSIASQPFMKWRRLSACDQFKYEFCCDIWVGWRGDYNRGVQPTETEEWYSYDNSYVMNICDQFKLSCAHCTRVQSECCADHDDAPRFLRSEEIRRLVLDRYDWQMSRRNVKDKNIGGNEDLIDYNLREGYQFVRYPLPHAFEVDALYTARLYHQVKCTMPRVRYGNDQIASYLMAGCDVRYRGSELHNQPTLEDHLIVLAGLVINAANTFPFVKAGEYGKCGMGWSRNIGPQGNVRRGRIVPQDAEKPAQ